MTNKEAVEQGAQLFADAEASLIALSSGLPAIINTVRDAGLIGGLEALSRNADSLSAINGAIAMIADVHETLTNRCKELGIDLPPPATAKSGVTPLSGGR